MGLAAHIGSDSWNVEQAQLILGACVHTGGDTDEFAISVSATTECGGLSRVVGETGPAIDSITTMRF